MHTPIDSLQPGYRQPLSRSTAGWNDHFKDHSAYWAGSWEPRHVTKYSQLGFSYIGHLAYPSLTENYIIGEKLRSSSKSLGHMLPAAPSSLFLGLSQGGEMLNARSVGLS